MTKPAGSKLFTLIDVLVWGGLNLSVTGLAIGASLTKQDPPVAPIGWCVLWATVLLFWIVAALYFRQRWIHLKKLHFVIDPPGLAVGWEEDQYRVSDQQVQAVYDDLIAKMAPTYPQAAAALRGCVVMFCEPVWIQDTRPGFLPRKVAGVQDGMLLLIGWRADLQSSALRHEMAHRVLQMCAGDPSEAAAHEVMLKLDVG